MTKKLSGLKPIETEVGFLEGRNAVYLDSFCHEPEHGLILRGEFSAPLCSAYRGTDRWLGYSLMFDVPRFWQMWELDICPFWTESSFDERIDSPEIRVLKLDPEVFHQYIVSTYDFIYAIVCQRYTLTLTGGRPQTN